MRIAIAIPIMLAAGCGLFGDDAGQVRRGANYYRVELNQLAQRIDEYAISAAAACSYSDAVDVPALRAPCRHMEDLDVGVRVAWKVAHRALDVAEESGVVLDEGTRVIARVRRLVDELGVAVDFVQEVVRNELAERRGDVAGDGGSGFPGSPPAQPDEGPAEGAAAEAGPEPEGDPGPTESETP